MLCSTPYLSCKEEERGSLVHLPLRLSLSLPFLSSGRKGGGPHMWPGTVPRVAMFRVTEILYSHSRIYQTSSQFSTLGRNISASILYCTSNFMHKIALLTQGVLLAFRTLAQSPTLDLLQHIGLCHLSSLKIQPFEVALLLGKNPEPISHLDVPMPTLIPGPGSTNVFSFLLDFGGIYTCSQLLSMVVKNICFPLKWQMVSNKAINPCTLMSD